MLATPATKFAKRFVILANDMDYKVVKNKEEWQELVGGLRPNQFLQSWEWGEFQSSLGREVRRIKIERDGEAAALAQAVRHTLPFGLSYIYVPRGPLVTPTGANHLAEVMPVLIRGVKDFSPQSIFFRAESVGYNPCEFGWRKVKDVQPSHTLMLALDRSEEEILADMHQKTRYNIRVAERHGVVVRKMERGDFDGLWELIKMTSERDEFRSHAKGYYEKMIENAGEMLEVWFAEFKGRAVAANIMINYGEVTTYLHGASSREHKNVMAPYLLHWEMIKKAKAEGREHYDFWGVAPEDAEPGHSWAGISRFKRGFGGTEVSYPGTFDLALNSFWYFLYKLKTKR